MMAEGRDAVWSWVCAKKYRLTEDVHYLNSARLITSCWTRLSTVPHSCRGDRGTITHGGQEILLTVDVSYLKLLHLITCQDILLLLFNTLLQT